MGRLTRTLLALSALVPATVMAGTVTLTGTRTNISPGGSPGGRCAPALTVSFAPGAFAASGSTNIGNFSYTASHCIAGPPPGVYYDGQFEWTLQNGTLFGTHEGLLALSGTPGVFDVLENLVFTGGTGKFLGASGFATASGTVAFGQFGAGFASFGNAVLNGQLTAPALPEPASWAMLIIGFGLTGAMMRRRQAHAMAA